MRQYTRRITRIVPWALVALLVAGSGFPLANAKGRPGYIHACVDRKTRVAHIVGANRACSYGQVSKGWNARGPRGPRGRSLPKHRTYDVCVGPSGQLWLADSRGEDGAGPTFPIAKGNGGGNGNGGDNGNGNGNGGSNAGGNGNGNGGDNGDGNGNGGSNNGNGNGGNDNGNGNGNGGDNGNGNGNGNGTGNGACTGVLRVLVKK